jgi:signal transduction histidine kinase
MASKRHRFRIEVQLVPDLVSTSPGSVKTPASSRWSQVRDFLFPHAAERDPDFRREIERLSVRSLYIIAAVCLGMPAMAALAHGVAQLFEPRTDSAAPWLIPAFLSLAAALITSARLPWGRKHARLIALLSGFASAGILIWGQFLGYPRPEEAPLASLISVAIVLLVGVTSIPALPWQIFALGVGIGWFHWFSGKLAVHWELIPPISLHHYAGMDMFTLLCTALSAVGYHRIFEAYRSHRGEMAAQSQLLVSQNAASMARFAATLSHELNTPIGALTSTVDSIRTLGARKAQADAAERQQLERVESELFETATRSAEYLRSVLGRMRRFTNLDRAEVIPVDVGELLTSVSCCGM